MTMHAQAVHPSRYRSELGRTMSPQYGSVYGPFGIANPVGEPWFALGKDIFQTILEEALSETTSSKAPEVTNSSGTETKNATMKDTGSYRRPSNDSPPTSSGLLGSHTELVKLLTSEEKNKRTQPSELVKLLTAESENRSLQAGFQKQSGSALTYSADQTSREIGLLQPHDTPTSEVVNTSQNVDRVTYERSSSLRRDATPYSRPTVTIHSANLWRSSLAGPPSGMQSLHNKTSLQMTETLHRESLLRKRFADSSRQKPDVDSKSPATEKSVFTNSLVCGRDMNSPGQHPQSPIKKTLKRRISGQLNAASTAEVNSKYCFDQRTIPRSFSRNLWEQQVLKQSSSNNTGLLGCSMPLKLPLEGYETNAHVTGVHPRHQATDDGELRCPGSGSSPRISPTEDLGRFETGSPECSSQPRAPVDSKLLLKSGWAQIDKDVLTGIVEHLSITCLQDNLSNPNGPRQSNTKPGTLDLSMPKPTNSTPYSRHRQTPPDCDHHEALDYSLKRSNACSVSKSERKRRHSTTVCDRSDIENVRDNFNSHPPVKFRTTKSCDAFETSTKIGFPRVKKNFRPTEVRRTTTSGRNELWGVVNKSVIHDMVEYLLMTLFPVETSSENGSGKVLKAVDNSMESTVRSEGGGNCDRIPVHPRKEKDSNADPSFNISSIPIDALENGTHACKYPRDTSHSEKEVTPQTVTPGMNPVMTPGVNVTSSPSRHSNGVNCSVRKVASSSATSGSTMESDAISWKWKTNILLRLSNDQQNSTADWNLRSLPNSAGELIA